MPVSLQSWITIETYGHRWSWKSHRHLPSFNILSTKSRLSIVQFLFPSLGFYREV